MKFFQQYKHVFLYSLSLAILLVLLKWFQWKFLILNHSLDLYIGIIAVFFTVLGIWVAGQLTKTKIQTVIIEKEVTLLSSNEFVHNKTELDKLQLSPREWEVLQLMAEGKSNSEIAEQLFLSVSTIKTHVSNVFVKMDVKSRAKAMEKAKRLNITP